MVWEVFKRKTLINEQVITCGQWVDVANIPIVFNQMKPLDAVCVCVRKHLCHPNIPVTPPLVTENDNEDAKKQFFQLAGMR